jgi:hypothetical protein
MQEPPSSKHILHQSADDSVREPLIEEYSVGNRRESKEEPATNEGQQAVVEEVGVDEQESDEVLLQRARANGRALTGLVIGVFSLILWWLPVLGALIAGIGLLIAIRRFHEIGSRKTAYAGVILNSVGLLLGLVFTVGIIFSIVHAG